MILDQNIILLIIEYPLIINLFYSLNQKRTRFAGKYQRKNRKVFSIYLTFHLTFHVAILFLFLFCIYFFYIYSPFFTTFLPFLGASSFFSSTFGACAGAGGADSSFFSEGDSFLEAFSEAFFLDSS